MKPRAVAGLFAAILCCLSTLSAAGFLGQPKSQFTRRAVLEDLDPIPPRSTCRLSWYEQAPPSFGNKVLCSGGDSTCLEPCSSGYELLQGTGLCLQKCPDKAAGPAQLCAPSRTCVRGASTCPVLAEVPYLCTAPDEFIGSCAKQSYQALVQPASTAYNTTCEDGLIMMDHTGGWRCMKSLESKACSPGFSSDEEYQGSSGRRCKQTCPSWLIDCGGTCNMPGVPCMTQTEHLCPVVPLEACDMQQRASEALQTACQSMGNKGPAGCPLTLLMHGSCGGHKLQVAVGLRNQGFIKKVEVWWGPSANNKPWQMTSDGPLIAIRVSFTGDKEPEVFGNVSHTYTVSPRLKFNLDINELVVSSKLWSSMTVMEGSRLTPVLAGFDLFTSARKRRTAGGAHYKSLSHPAVINAMQHRLQNVSLSGNDLGVGLPVGAAAYTSASGIHAFGFVYLARVARQEL